MPVQFSTEFKKNLTKLARRYRHIQQDIQPVIDQLTSGATPGDRITGIGQIVYKVRIKNSDSNKGKRGGYRLLYYLKTHNDILLITLYSKSDQTDIQQDTLQRLLRNYMGDDSR